MDYEVLRTDEGPTTGETWELRDYGGSGGARHHRYRVYFGDELLSKRGGDDKVSEANKLYEQEFEAREGSAPASPAAGN